MLTLPNLQDEVNLGRRAESAYDGYVRQFIERAKTKLYESFTSAPVTDAESIMEVKRLFAALASLETAILHDIETGRLALRQLESMEKQSNV